MREIALYGTFDVSNYGDCMFPHLWEHLLRERFPDLNVSLYSPTNRASPILGDKELRAVPIEAFDQNNPHYAKADIHILIGGETVGAGHGEGTYVYPFKTPSAYLRQWAGCIASAHRAREQGGGSFVALYAAGLAPGRDHFLPAISACIAHVDYASFRDAVSIDRLTKAKPDDVKDLQLKQSTDPMFLISTLRTDEQWRDLRNGELGQFGADGYIALQLSPTYFAKGSLTEYANRIIDFVAESSLPLVLLPVCHFLCDEILLRQFSALLKDRNIESHIVSGAVDVHLTAAVIGGADLMICTSLHAAVTSISFDIPVAAICHGMEGKHYGVLKSVGLERAAIWTPTALSELLANKDRMVSKGARERGMSLARASLDDLFHAIDQSQPTTPVPSTTAWWSAINALRALEEAVAAPTGTETLRRRLHLALAYFSKVKTRYLRLRAARKLPALW